MSQHHITYDYLMQIKKPFAPQGKAATNAVSPLGVGLPDFRNIGVMLRVMVLCALCFVISAYLTSASWPQALARLMEAGLMLASLVLSMVIVLFCMAPWLSRQAYRVGIMLIIALGAGLSALMDVFFSGLWGQPSAPGRAAFLAGLLCAAIVAYFDHRQRVLSPALSEARLMALQARIRPHFLFNSLNTVVSVIRRDPRLAEEIVLNLAELFRALLADTRGLVRLADEVQLARAYLDIEALRLGPRLRVDWDLSTLPANAKVPTLILQPLLENAVHHGIEPSSEGGQIQVRIRAVAKRLEIRISNPVSKAASSRQGNRMALANIEERLMLHFDAEAELRQQRDEGFFTVDIKMPLVYTA